MKLELPAISEAERTPLVQQLLGVIDAQQQRIAELEEKLAQLRDDNAILKGLKPRPKITPSQLEAPPPKPPPAPGGKRPGSAKRSKNASFVNPIEVRIPFPDPPPGSSSKAFEEYFVQELLITTKVTRYLRERVVTPDGHSLLAPLPDGVPPGSHFGANLIAFLLHQHFGCNVTQPLLHRQMRQMGIDISAGQINRILTEGHGSFHQEKAEVLTVGLQTAGYVGVDDTGARHGGHNGFCTAIANDLFACFESTDSKSRLNFLAVMRGGSTAYAINEVALAYWKMQELSDGLIGALQGGPSHFADEAAWKKRLVEVGINCERLTRIATEGAVLGQVVEQGVRAELVVLSDGAAQFDVLLHASCWIHAERPLARMTPYNELHRAEIERLREQIWQLYRDLKAYRAEPEPGLVAGLQARFDALVEQKTEYSSSRAVLKEMKAHKEDLLRVLLRPEVPLHNNGTESDIRCYVKVRKVSGSTRSDEGRRCRDTFTSLKKTCAKLGVSFWEYLNDRVRRRGQVPRLGELIRHKAQQKQEQKQTAGQAQAASPEAVGCGAAR